MIRLTLILCSAIFLVFVIGGRDHGQTRAGLVPREAPVAVAAATPAPEPQRALITNEPRLLQVRAEREIVPEPVAAAKTPDLSQMMPVVYVNATSVNVRQGPSTQDAIVGKLDRGDAALVVWTDDTGWSRIRIEGDGVEGYVASRFLTGMPSY
ncbi:SH3 domain-containing protein [Falsirhodobacter xinxiangensis]|uniref:SH3 domain-containing protein n=1 Tax=Falsirhodobacter xinxiangensis TaxID=2530049 RepID=UPI0010AA054D|nr:SH3 domain-containing protein [Rhodobacter xinxiangensis]